MRLRSERTGLDLARARQGNAAFRPCSRPASRIDGAHEVAVGCLIKPYSERQLIKAIECVDRHLQNEKYKPPKGLEIFVDRRAAKNDRAEALGRPPIRC